MNKEMNENRQHRWQILEEFGYYNPCANCNRSTCGMCLIKCACGDESKELIAEIIKEKLPDCPIGDLSCPYCNKDFKCTLDNPNKECDDYMYYNQSE